LSVLAIVAGCVLITATAATQPLTRLRINTAARFPEFSVFEEKHLNGYSCKSNA